MKMSLVTSAYPDNKLEYIIEKATDLNYEGVELRPTRRISVPTSLKSENLKSLSKLLADSNIEISCISPLVTFTDENASIRLKNIDILKSCIDIAHNMGCKRVRAFGGPISGDRDAAMGHVLESLSMCADYAEKEEVNIDIETHDDFNTGRIVLTVLERVASPKVKALYDVAWPFCAGEPYELTIQLLRDHLDFVHLKDIIRNEDGIKYVLFGKGELKPQGIVEKLKEIGYEGYLAVEWEKDEDPNLEDSDIAAKHYAREVKKIIGSS